ncbi:MAG TPA: hypothetical protein VGL77_20440 [Armatimonadota bacterium]
MTTEHTCAFCGHHFSAAESAVSCAKCSLFGVGGCRKVRCPHCQYEMAPPARLPRLVADVVKKIRGVH